MGGNDCIAIDCEAAAGHQELPRNQAMLGSAEAWDHAAHGYRKFGSVRSTAGLKAARLQAGETALDVATGPGMNWCLNYFELPQPLRSLLF